MTTGSDHFRAACLFGPGAQWFAAGCRSAGPRSLRAAGYEARYIRSALREFKNEIDGLVRVLFRGLLHQAMRGGVLSLGQV
ncbi:hypothetical protein BDV10DRAFT_179693 [Aspergillus recurvatus]